MAKARQRLPKGLPLRRVEAARPVRIEKAGGAWRLVSAGPVRAEIVHPPDAFLCRPGRPRGDEVVQLAIGRVRSRLATALYSPSKDLLLRFGGRTLRIEWSAQRGCYVAASRGGLSVTLERRYYERGLGLTWYRPLERRVFDRAPSGWCSWYIFHKDVDESKVMRNLRWLRGRLAPFGLQVVQVDDGWQGTGRGHGGDRDWFVPCARKFPHGMKWLADRIREAGLVPGLWLIPQTQSDTRLFRARPEMFLRDARGKSVSELKKPLPHAYIPIAERRFRWTGRYALDPTRPAAAEYLARLARHIVDEWGYEYLKMDGQSFLLDVYRQHRDRFADPKATPEEAYRRTLAAVRAAVGPRRYLLNCLQGWPSAGLCDGIRTGWDAHPDLAGIETAADTTFRHLYLNGLAWWTDPDVVCVRPPLSLEQARLWVTLLALTGQAFMASDDMPRLAPERAALLERALPVAAARPMELYSIKDRPAILDLKVHKPGVGEWDVAGVFNWSRRWAMRGEVTAEALGLAPARRGFLFFDVWRERLLATGTQGVALSIPPMQCRVLAVRRVEDRPQVAGTSRHLAQGADDLESVRWDGRAGALRGRSRVVGGEPYRLYFTVPDGWTAADGAVRRRGGLGVMVLRRAESGPVDWEVRFRRRT